MMSIIIIIRSDVIPYGLLNDYITLPFDRSLESSSCSSTIVSSYSASNDIIILIIIVLIITTSLIAFILTIIIINIFAIITAGTLVTTNMSLPPTALKYHLQHDWDSR